MLYLAGDEEKTAVQCGDYSTIITTFKNGRGKWARLGSAFPEMPPLGGAEAAGRVQAVYRGNRDRRRYQKTVRDASARVAPWTPARAY